jgi:hypothetical protein
MPLNSMYAFMSWIGKSLPLYSNLPFYNHLFFIFTLLSMGAPLHAFNWRLNNELMESNSKDGRHRKINKKKSKEKC